jgi:AraC-like DNA-binding protein
LTVRIASIGGKSARPNEPAGNRTLEIAAYVTTHTKREGAMTDQMRASSPVAYADPADHQLAGRLINQLKLQFCNVLQEPQSVTLRTIPIGRTNFVLMENMAALDLKARVGAATSVIWFGVKGSARLSFGQERMTCTAGNGCIWPAEVDVRILTARNHSALAIRIDHAVLEHELARLLGRPIRAPLVFNPSLDVNKNDNILGPLMHFIYRASDLTSASFVTSGILSAAIETLFLDTLLTTQPSNYSAALNALHAVAVPRHVRAAMRAVKANPERPWRLSEMAEEGGVSVRTMCESFQKFCACTPKQFVQMVRLALVRKELARKPKAMSIARVARQCGFRHPGRFAATYHRVYGEAPSETIHRMAFREVRNDADLGILRD